MSIDHNRETYLQDHYSMSSCLYSQRVKCFFIFFGKLPLEMWINVSSIDLICSDSNFKYLQIFVDSATSGLLISNVDLKESGSKASQKG